MEKKISDFSNSEIGTAHWFNTLIGNSMNVGQYLHLHGSTGISEETLAEWGMGLWERSKELMQWYEKTGLADRNRLILQLEEAIKVLKEEENNL